MAYGKQQTTLQKPTTLIAKKTRLSTKASPLTSEIASKINVSSSRSLGLDVQGTGARVQSETGISVPSTRKVSSSSPRGDVAGDGNPFGIAASIISIGKSLGAISGPTSEPEEKNVLQIAASNIIGGVKNIFGFEEGGFVSKNRGNK
mgnify:CR=1 FL=1|tara:strand:+ start:158 stop:598 length:441 start_codon:yes stop_codon:yes gene_type:complete